MFLFQIGTFPNLHNSLMSDYLLPMATSVASTRGWGWWEEGGGLRDGLLKLRRG